MLDRLVKRFRNEPISTTPDAAKVARLTEFAAEQGHRIAVSEGSLVVDLKTGEHVILPLLLDRKIDDLRRPEEAPFDREVFDRVAGRALYEGFVSLETGVGAYLPTDRLLDICAFKDEKGRVITYEARKSYMFGSGYHYSKSSFYKSEEEYHRALNEDEAKVKPYTGNIFTLLQKSA